MCVGGRLPAPVVIIPVLLTPTLKHRLQNSKKNCNIDDILVFGETFFKY